MCVLPSSCRYGWSLWVPLSYEYYGCVWHEMLGLFCSSSEGNVSHHIGGMSPETLLGSGAG